MKRHPDAATAAVARRRSTALCAAGLATPYARQGTDERDVVFERIDGETGQRLVDTDLGPILSAVARLHRSRVPGLPAYDPFRRIRPRLALATRIPVREILAEPVQRGTATLHGDLHVGQLIRDARGKVWIVDLDDMAAGPPEADLANFAAHLATSPGSPGIAHAADRVTTAWRRLGERHDDKVFARFLRFALVRRHLKLRQSGRPDHEADVLAYLRDSSNFSIR